MLTGNALHDGQSQTAAGRSIAGAYLADVWLKLANGGRWTQAGIEADRPAVKPVEHPRPFVSRNARTGIANLNDGTAILTQQREIDATTRRGIFDRIVDQIIE